MRFELSSPSVAISCNFAESSVFLKRKACPSGMLPAKESEWLGHHILCSNLLFLNLMKISFATCSQTPSPPCHHLSGTVAHQSCPKSCFFYLTLWDEILSGFLNILPKCDFFFLLPAQCAIKGLIPCLHIPLLETFKFFLL